MQKHSAVSDATATPTAANAPRRAQFAFDIAGGRGYSNPASAMSAHDFYPYAGIETMQGLPPSTIEAATYQGVPRNETEYKAWLDRTFRHYFEPHETAGGVPTSLLVDILRSDASAEYLRRGKLSRLMRDMDANKDGRISWAEFFNKVTITRRQDLTRGQRFIIGVIRAAAPAVERHKRLNSKTFGSDQLDGGEVEEEYDSYLEAYNCCPPPIFILISCLAQIICFIVYAIELNNGPESNRVGWTTGLPYYSPLVFDPRKMKEAWRFLSYMLLHCGYHHILFNLVIQILLGIPLELVHKAWRVGPAFLAGVLGGSVCSAVFDHSTQLVGASGGCYALMGAHIALVVMNWEELQRDWLKCRSGTGVLSFLLSGVMRLIMLLLLIGLDFGVALYQRFGLSQDTRVSFLAHIGGLLFGFLVGIPVLKNLDKKPWEAYVFWISLIIGVGLMVAALLYLCVTALLETY